MIYDAVGYETLGRLIVEQGWDAYFRAGPQREPLFPWLISRAMYLEVVTGIPYVYFVKGLLLSCLAGTVVLVYRLTRNLGAGRGGGVMAAFYIGISPAMTNSALWMWSEALTYPLVLSGVILLALLCRQIKDDHVKAGKVLLTALGTGGLFFVLTMVKASVAFIWWALIAPFLVLFIRGLYARHSSAAWKAAGCFLVLAVVFGGLVEGYKYLNFRANGQYVITDRVDWALYGNTVRRLQPLTEQRINQLLLSLPRLGLCEGVYGRPACAFWDFPFSNALAERARHLWLAQGLSEQEISSRYFRSSLELMGDHPWQQGLLMLAEGAKALFWENRVYFVKYPAWLSSIYYQWWLVLGLCFGWALLALWGILRALFRLCDPRRGFVPELFYPVWFLMLFVGGYSFYFIDLRHMYPIAPVLVILGCSAVWPRDAEKQDFQ